MDDNQGAARRSTVAMIVANDVSVDTRVQKAAAAAASFGYDVVLLGFAPGKRREEAFVGDARLIRLPLDYVLRDDARARRFRRPVPTPRSRKLRYVADRRRIKLKQSGLRAQLSRDNNTGRNSVPYRVLRKVEGVALRVRLALVDQKYERSRSRRSSPPAGRSVTTSAINKIRRRHWQSIMPEVADYELAFGAELDAIKPDLIHAHDVHLLSVACEARDRAALGGKAPVVVYDSHEYIPGLASVHPERIQAFTDLERKHIGSVDRIITVSPLLAEWLERDHSPEHPVSVVMNMPSAAWNAEDHHVPSLRNAVGVGADTDLIVYSGGYNRTRGVMTLIEAMPLLDGVHLALVAKLPNSFVDELLRTAEELGCRDRIRLAPFVEPNDVARYLSEADVAVHPMLHAPNHEVALPNKYFEYLHARVPIVVSDVQSMAEMTRRYGFGEVFTAESATELASAVRLVLDDREKYASKITDDLIDEFSWERQAEVLRDLYVACGLHAENPEAQVATAIGIRGIRTVGETSDHRLLIGPSNSAGQATAWAEAVQRHSTDHAESLAIDRPTALNWPAHTTVPIQSWKSLEWQCAQLSTVRDRYSHVLAESGRGVLGLLAGGLFEGDQHILGQFGVSLGLVVHGSEVRSPRQHAELETESPFTDPMSATTVRLQEAVDRLLPSIRSFDGQVFVTTLDLLDYLPGAAWLPVVVDLETWKASRQALEEGPPVVLHAPSDSELKGSEAVEDVCRRLHDEGVIDYRSVSDVPPTVVVEMMREADVVLDQFVIGDFGVMAVQAMAAGRLVLAHIADRVGERLPFSPPIVESTLDGLEATLRAISERPSAYREVAASGPDYVGRLHDGRLAAVQLSRWMDGCQPLGLEEIRSNFGV